MRCSLRRPAPRVLLLAVLLFALAVSWLARPAPADAARAADSWSVPPTATITVTGHGYGHGHGMSQWGAQGAGLQGLSARQITDFYYPGTTWGRAGGSIAVLITADSSKDVVVQREDGLVVRALDKHKTYRVARLRTGASAWRLVPKGSRTSLDYRTDRWRTLTVFKGPAEFSAGRAPLTLRLPSGTRATYRGALRSVGHDTVNVVGLEAYLRGVVPREVPAQWTPAAVQAQAVAARTYAAYERAEASSSRGFQVFDTTASQVYGGVAAEQPESDAAVRATRRQVVTYAGAPAFTQFSASNGGWTSAGAQPYLTAQSDPYDAAGGANPHTSWSVALTDRRIEQTWPTIGDLQRIEVTMRDGHGDLGGRADGVVLSGSAGSVTVTGETFRFLMGLKSDWFTFSVA